MGGDVQSHEWSIIEWCLPIWNMRFCETSQLTSPVTLRRSYSMLSRDNPNKSTKGLIYRHTFILWIRVEKITVMFRIELFGNDLYPHWPKLSCSLAWSAILRWWGVRANDANKLPWLILTDLLTCLLDWPKNFKDPRYLHNSLGFMALGILRDLFTCLLDWPKNFKDSRYLHNSLGSTALGILTDIKMITSRPK